MFGKSARNRNTGVVYKDINAAKRNTGVLHCLAYTLSVGYVNDRRDVLVGRIHFLHFRLRFLQPRLVIIADYYYSAFPDKLLGDCLAYASGAAGNKSNLASK